MLLISYAVLNTEDQGQVALLLNIFYLSSANIRSLFCMFLCPISLYLNETLPGSGLIIKDCWLYCIYHRLNTKNPAPNNQPEI